MKKAEVERSMIFLISPSRGASEGEWCPLTALFPSRPSENRFVFSGRRKTTSRGPVFLSTSPSLSLRTAFPCHSQPRRGFRPGASLSRTAPQRTPAGLVSLMATPSLHGCRHGLPSPNGSLPVNGAPGCLSLPPTRLALLPPGPATLSSGITPPSHHRPAVSLTSRIIPLSPCPFPSHQPPSPLLSLTVSLRLACCDVPRCVSASGSPQAELDGHRGAPQEATLSGPAKECPRGSCRSMETSRVPQSFPLALP